LPQQQQQQQQHGSVELCGAGAVSLANTGAPTAAAGGDGSPAMVKSAVLLVVGWQLAVHCSGVHFSLLPSSMHAWQSVVPFAGRRQCWSCMPQPPYYPKYHQTQNATTWSKHQAMTTHCAVFQRHQQHPAKQT
jgi:hypothetical protein